MTDPRLEDLAILVRRFAHSTRNDGKYSALREQAMDYLERHGLTGDTLRPSKPQIRAAQMNDIDAAFKQNTTYRTEGTRHRFTCKRGFWEVEAPTFDKALSEARHYFRQYFTRMGSMINENL